MVTDNPDCRKSLQTANARTKIQIKRDLCIMFHSIVSKLKRFCQTMVFESQRNFMVTEEHNSFKVKIRNIK